ncbi:F-box only protein 7-like [Sinocyclocheilus anshuiensis]|uniref:F-box only protein 7-like n=1 Tax=Sinocyclocheilus anshuiensis TaxID=1608454 RepID=UPI0007BA2647|nr:PREDICTED: F-box only protein 7-like [Sinocyclocheilus anshuiensis]
MKLRVRIHKQSSRLELDGPEPTLSELRARVRDALLPRCGLGADVEFSLSLNGKEVLLDTGQTLSSCGVVSGDMITVILPEQIQTAPEPPSGAGGAAASSEEAEASGGGGSDSSSVRDSGMEEWMEDEAGVSPPLLCCETEDGVIPHALERLLNSSSCRNPTDCLMLTVHLLLLETGFLPQGCNVNSGEMPIGWRAAGCVYRLHYAHPLLENSLVSAVAVPMGRTLVINAVLKMDKSMENSRKLVLKPDDYVTADWAGGCTGVVYTDLRRLSRLFKDQLVYPLMAAARQALGLPALFGLAVLPPELLLRVLRLLDVVVLRQGPHNVKNFRFYNPCGDMWSPQCSIKYTHTHTHTPDSVCTDEVSVMRVLCCFAVCFPAGNQHRDTDWKELYKKKLKQRKENERRGRCRFFPPHVPPIFPLTPIPSAPLPLPLPLYPPGIIGGDYDQAPVILPRPRFDPIGPLPGHLPGLGVPIGRRSLRPGGSRPADVRRGFI